MTRRGERGDASLPGLLTAMVIMVVVLSAALSLLDGVSTVVADGTRRTDAQDGARSGIDRMTDALRNLASPTPEQPQAVDAAGPQDLVFKTVDPQGPNAGTNATNTMRVRYCLGARRIWEQQQTWTSATIPATPAVGVCPAAGWTRTRMLVDDVDNGTVPLFSYDATVLSEIAGIHVETLVDPDPAKAPVATRVSGGVFLRNQNRPPAAHFVVSRGGGQVVLNGTGSADPEGRPLTYDWFDGTTPIGTGITLSRPLAAGAAHQFRLRVTDPAGLQADSAVQAVTG